MKKSLWKAMKLFGGVLLLACLACGVLTACRKGHEHSAQWHYEVGSGHTHKKVCGNSGCPGTMENCTFEQTVEDGGDCLTGATVIYTCKYCNYSYRDTIPVSLHSLTPVAEISATCTEAGNNAYYKCSVCHKCFTDEGGRNQTTAAEQTVPKLNHHMVEHAAKDASCTEDGNNKYYECDRCYQYCSTDAAGANQTTAAAQAIQKLNHHMVEHAAKDANCTEDGNNKYYECDRCNNYCSTDAAGANKTTAAAQAIQKLNHHMVEHAAKAASCTEDGNNKYYECDRCNNYCSTDAAGANETTVAAQTIEKFNHHMVEHAAKDASCTQDGNNKYYECDRCNKYYSTDAAGENQTTLQAVTIPAGHQGEFSYTPNGGGTHTAKCERATCPGVSENCNYLHVDGFDEREDCTVPGTGKFACEDCGHEKTGAIAAGSHQLQPVSAKPNTCTENGNEAYYKCSVCGKCFTDAAGKNGTTESAATIPAGHQGEFSYTPNNNGTHTAKCERASCPGKNENCNYEYVEGSDERDSCDEAGTANYRCTACGHQKSVPIAAGSHSLRTVARKEASCLVPGNILYYVCAVCGKYFSDEHGATPITLEDTVISATGSHTLTAVPASATCTSAGVIAHYACEVCHDTFLDEAGNTPVSSVAAPALGHAGEPIVLGASGLSVQGCTRCGESVALLNGKELAFDHTPVANYGSGNWWTGTVERTKTLKGDFLAQYTWRKGGDAGNSDVVFTMKEGNNEWLSQIFLTAVPWGSLYNAANTTETVNGGTGNYHVGEYTLTVMRKGNLLVLAVVQKNGSRFYTHTDVLTNFTTGDLTLCLQGNTGLISDVRFGYGQASFAAEGVTVTNTEGRRTIEVDGHSFTARDEDRILLDPSGSIQPGSAAALLLDGDFFAEFTWTSLKYTNQPENLTFSLSITHNSQSGLLVHKHFTTNNWVSLGGGTDSNLSNYGITVTRTTGGTAPSTWGGNYTTSVFRVGGTLYLLETVNRNGNQYWALNVYEGFGNADLTLSFSGRSSLEDFKAAVNHTHTFSAAPSSDAHCTEEVVVRRVCSTCKLACKQVIGPLGHSYVQNECIYCHEEEPYYETNYPSVGVHDPCILIAYEDRAGRTYPENAEGRTKVYFTFGTMCSNAYSYDLNVWIPFSNNLNQNPYAELAASAEYSAQGSNPGEYNLDGNLWAPDVLWNPTMKKWCMYMSVNGDKYFSSIVLLTADDLRGDWTYVGTVVWSGINNSNVAKTDYTRVTGSNTVNSRYSLHRGGGLLFGVNAIDACVFYDEGKLYMSYGSWFGGIYLLELDEETGLRDYNVTYEYDVRDGSGAKLPESTPLTSDSSFGKIYSDPYLGVHIAGGHHASSGGEGSFIRKIGDYYYLWLSYAGLNPTEGYNMRLFRSASLKGPYVDAGGGEANLGDASNQWNGSLGLRIMTGYQWSWWNYAYVAQGHNSVLLDDDGRIYLVYHNKYMDGTYFHRIKVHEMLVNSDDWLVTTPFETHKSDTVAKGLTNDEIAGEYGVIYLTRNNGAYGSPCTESSVTLNANGTLTGLSGSWSYVAATGALTLKAGDWTHHGFMVYQQKEETNVYTLTFTVVSTDQGSHSQYTYWGYKVTDKQINSFRYDACRDGQGIPSTGAITSATITFTYHNVLSDWTDIIRGDSFTLRLATMTLNGKNTYENSANMHGNNFDYFYNVEDRARTVTISVRTDGSIVYSERGVEIFTFAANTGFSTDASKKISELNAAILNELNAGTVKFAYNVSDVTVSFTR